MSFKEWLGVELEADGYVGDEYEITEDTTVESLVTNTDLEDWDVRRYMDDFKAHCEAIGVEPIMDMDEE